MATNYVGLINSMLELRNQRLKEELAQQADQAAMWEGIGSGIGSLGSALGKGMQSYQQNSTANTMMNQMAPPRAQSMSDELNKQAAMSPLEGQIPYNQIPVTMQPHTGGKSELDMVMDMEKLRQSSLKASIPSASQQRLDWDKSNYLVKQAREAEKLQSAELKQGKHDYDAYIKQEKVYKDAMSNAKNPIDYDNAVDALIAHNNSAVDYGMKQVQPIDRATIPPYMSPAEKQTLASQQAAVETAGKNLRKAQDAPLSTMDSMRQGLGLGSWAGTLSGTPDKDASVKSAQEKFEKEQERLRAMPGGSRAPVSGQPGTVPTTGTSAAPAATSTPVGKKVINDSTGEIKQWDGSKWVTVK